ncbi:MAG: cobyrinate a,c-diamide synthase [Cytophagales bacterium]|nr:cobyrinate a,c-diamide synthase [Cytophagales bacterium]
MISTPQFMVAAPSSHSGKTTVTLGLLRAFQRKGRAVQPFKCGPDYLDTTHHTLAAGQQGINLDLFMSSSHHVKYLYQKYCENKEVVVVESVMGLYDGAVDDRDSSAAIAKLLQLPVILVVDARAMAYSAGALVYGFKHFDPEINLAGVIFNFVRSASHYRFLRDACKKIGVTPLGYLPPEEKIKIPSRYLGLNIDATIDFDVIIDRTADHLEQHLDLDQLAKITRRPLPGKPGQLKSETVNPGKVIAIARDEAFRFTYHENIETLKRLGKVVYFSPMHDTVLPNADFIYLAGGYPELHVQALAKNKEMLHAVRQYCLQGGHLLAECGGFMYLGRQVIDAEGQAHEMVNFFPSTTSMVDKKLTLGYRAFSWEHITWKGHEFHYSTLTGADNLPSVGGLFNAKQEPVGSKVYRKGNVMASYVHFYWAEQEDFLQQFIFTETVNK